MNSALRQKPAEERDLEIEQDKALFARVLAEIAPRGDMAQLDEPEQRKPRFPWEWIAYAAALCVAVAWVVMEVVE
jgi:hypothetical protein